MNDLDVPPGGKSAAKAPAKIHLAGYEHIPMEGHYSDPNEWANRLQNNPPQPNYVNVNSLEGPGGNNINAPGEIQPVLRAPYAEANPSPLNAEMDQHRNVNSRITPTTMTSRYHSEEPSH